LGPAGDLELIALEDDAPRIVAATATPVEERAWILVRATADASRGAVTIESRPIAGNGRGTDASKGADAAVAIPGAARCVAAAVVRRESAGRPMPEFCFNGKIERPRVEGGRPATSTVFGEWAFERLEAVPDKVVDISCHGRHGWLLNTPTRAVTGSRWTGAQLCFRSAPSEYAAIHFHDDDLADAGWRNGIATQVPANAESGVYAVRLTTPTTGRDYVPFAVVPHREAEREAVTFLMPTYTYLAYANEHLVHQDFRPSESTGEVPVDKIELGSHDRAILDHPEYGLSLYDRHSDGSGVCYASLLRPLLNMRPDYRSWVHGAPRHFAADLYLVDWLRHEGIAFDVVTDQELHAEGTFALGDTSVVLTGSHPEYYSAAMLKALDAHLERGGRLMYLGGNGFYWVTSTHPSNPNVIEVRRGASGTRTWEAEPGEEYHSSTGEPGGLWRRRGRSPNRLVGVGFAAQLTGVRDATTRAALRARAFHRLADSFRQEVAFAFREIADDELIGADGLVMHGASGDEIDRYDVRFGSPADAFVLATSDRHDRHYLLCGEDQLMTAAQVDGSNNDLVRSDIVLLELPRGGSVFSVGSICFTGSLSHNHYDNAVAKLAANVLNNYIERGPVGARAESTRT
jgi:N,N-dimethylformamidase